MNNMPTDTTGDGPHVNNCNIPEIKGKYAQFAYDSKGKKLKIFRLEGKTEKHQRKLKKPKQHQKKLIRPI